jgi:hypothetical protein
MSNTDNRAAIRRPTATALGFLAAFILTTVTIIYTGLLVKSPETGADLAQPPARPVHEDAEEEHDAAESGEALEDPATSRDDSDAADDRSPDAPSPSSVDSQASAALKKSD